MKIAKRVAENFFVQGLCQLRRSSHSVAMMTLVLGVFSGCVSGSPWNKIIIPTEKESAPQPSVEREVDPLRTSSSATKIPEESQKIEKRIIDLASSKEGDTGPEQSQEPLAGIALEDDLKSVEELDLSSKIKAQTQKPQEESQVYRVDEGFVDQRLLLYTKKLSQWNEVAGGIIQLNQGNSWPEGWHECVQTTEMLIFDYRRVKSRLHGEYTSAPLDPWQLLAKDISYVEGNCENVFLQGKAAFAEDIASYSNLVSDEAMALVDRYFGMGLYAEAVAVYESQADIDGQVQDDSRLRKLYAEALLRSGRLDAAITILKEHNEKSAPIVNQNYLAESVHYADLLLAAGRYDEAAEVYGNIKEQLGAVAESEQWVLDQNEILTTNSSLLDVYSNILRLYYSSDRTYVPKEIYLGYKSIDQGSQGIMLGSVRKLLSELEQAVEVHVERQLAQAQQLLHDNEFGSARRIVEELSINGTDLIREKVQTILDQIDEAERVEKLSLKQLQQQKIKSQLQNALHLYEIKDYDAAIAEFTLLLNTEHKNEAISKISQAASFAANEMRRKAASLFVKARKTSDQEEKKSLLVESKEILEDLLAKYPGTDIVSKVQQNLQVLEDELSKYSL